MSLYNEARPVSVAELEGDFAHITSLLEKENHSHTFLFYGQTKGAGKTTLSRILAKQLGATDMDIREYNFSKDNGVETVRDIIEGLYLSPVGKARVYIIDEFQGATATAQKALRKDLEEPPEHVYFFLCTNEIDKVDSGIASRALKHEFPPLTEAQLVSVLDKAIFRLGMVGQIDSELFPVIASKVDGSARDALVLLESVLAIPNKKRESFLSKYTNGLDHPGLSELAELVYTGESWGSIMQILILLQRDKLAPETCRRYLLTYGCRKGTIRILEQASMFTETTFYNEWEGFIILCFKAYKAIR